MVRVVSAQPHPSVVKEVVCRRCGATLEYVPADIREEIHTDYTGGKDKYNYIVCPPCGHKVGVKGY
jgi:DNA-directed RNA polymerase subunit RPC12/RpoP